MNKPFSIAWIALLLALLAIGSAAPGAGQEPTGASSGAAIERYRAVLQQEPNNTGALFSLSQLLQAEGKWHEAMPLLEKLIQLEPGNSDALFQLGRMKTWASDRTRSEGLELMNRACEATKNPEYCSASAEVLSWKDETRQAAVVRLRALLSANPDSVSTRVRLAQILSWNETTRPESLSLFDEGLKLAPNNVDLLLASAEVLSWSGATRQDALSRYDRVLQQDRNNTKALTGKAQLLAWRNHSDEALDLYERVLEIDPANTAALRGKAEIMNWKGLYKKARSLAMQANREAPDDVDVRLELARANVGLQKFTEAQEALAPVQGNPKPDFDDVRHEIHRGLGTYIDIGYDYRNNHGQLDYHRFQTAISTRVGLDNRLTFAYQPTLYESNNQGFNGNYFQVGLDSTISDRLSSSVRAGAEVFNNVPANVDGALSFRYKPVSSTALRFSFERAPVEESLLSLRGLDTPGVFLGQVHSNLANLGLSYDNVTHKFDFSVDYTDGVYTGRNLDSNRRFSIDSQLGKSLRGEGPYIRVAYSMDYTSFDHDADIQTGVPLSRTTGGYFSPTRFLLNQGVLNVMHKFHKRLEWSLTGAAGVQNVENLTSTFSNAQFADSVETHLAWRINQENEFRFGYAYLNVFNAFERNLFRFSWRHYF